MRSLLFVAICMFLTAPAAEAGVTVSATSVKGDTHIEFRGLDEWRYDVSRKVVNGYRHVLVQFEGVSPDDLVKLHRLSDTRVRKVQVTAGLDGDALLDLTLSGPRVSFFDYQTDNPVNLVLDVYKDDAPKKRAVATKADKRSAKARALAELVEKTKKKFAARKKRGGRNVASVDAPEIGSQPLLAANDDQKLEFSNGVFDGGDKNMSRFRIQDREMSETAQIRSTNNLYVHFPELIYEHPYLKNLLADAPKYSVEADSSDENMQVRFILKLFGEKKFAVVLRTMKFFNAKYPVTNYQKILDFMTADTYLGLWQRDHDRADFEQAMTRYKEILEKYPDEPSRYRTLMLIGLNYLDAGNNMGALSEFQDGIKRFPDSPYYWQMRMAVGDALNSLDKSSDALKEYQSIESDPRAKTYAVEARYRMGDVFFKAKDYASAVKEYQDALKKYPDDWVQGPNIYFNGAEARFWTKDYKGSLDEFREFLQRFPNHDYGGYAMTRIGEILGILGASKKSTGAYLESYFRYRGTPGAFLAKVHVNTQRFAGMKDKEVNAVLDEVRDDMGAISDLPDLEPFVTLSLADGFTSRKEYGVSNDMLIKYYQTNVLSPYLDFFKNRIVQNITSEIGESNAKGDYVGALENFIKNSDSWLSQNGRLDTEFYAGQAYEALNVPEDASKLYKDCLARYRGLTDQQLKVARVFQDVPSPDRLNLRLASVSLKNDDVKRAGTYLSDIKSPGQMTQAEQVERSLILSSVAQKEERPDLALLALKDLTAHWSGNNQLLMKPWVQMARINRDLKKYDEAIPWIEKAVDAARQNPAGVDHDTAREALDLAGDLYARAGRTKEAIDAYKTYLDKFADSAPLAPVKFKLGQLYFDNKDYSDASGVWSGLKDDKDGEVWSKMADEKLAEAQWGQKYGRYLDRKPAGVDK